MKTYVVKLIMGIIHTNLETVVIFGEREKKGDLLGGYLNAFLFFTKRMRATKTNIKQKQIFGVPNHNAISLCTHWDGHYMYIHTMKRSVDTDMEKLEPLCTARGTVKRWKCYRKKYWSSLKS